MTAWSWRGLLSTLGGRLALTLVLAFVPIAIVTYYQTRALKDEIRARAEDGLLGRTARVAESETSTIREAQGLMKALALALPVTGLDPARCNALMRQVAQANPAASLVAFIPVDGRMQCSNTGKEHDFSGNPRFQKVRDARAPTFVVSSNGEMSHTSVLAVTHPVFDAEGRYLGYTAISLPHSGLTGPFPDGVNERTDNSQQPLYFWSFDGEGNLLTASVDLDDAALRVPADRSLSRLVGQKAQVFSTTSVAGNRRTYAVVPVIEGELYLMSSWRNDDDALVSQFVLTTYLAPLLMLAAGLVAAAWGAERLVIRHVNTLSRSMQVFARGDRRLEDIDLRHAPVELRELGEAYLSMTESITRGEAELEDIAHQRELLLREVHHRVKNNLQLIASIMNIQLRRTSSAEAKGLLKDLQDRVMSLATIHRGLFQTSGRTDVSAADLLPEIVQKLNALGTGPGPRPKVTLDIAGIRLFPDQVVPLALLLTDAVSSALRQVPAPDEVRVTLARTGETGAMLTVRSPSHEPETPSGDAEIGRQLMAAFARQLGGQLNIVTEDGHRTISLQFEVLPQASAGIPEV